MWRHKACLEGPMIVRMCELDAHFTSVSPPPAAPFAVDTIHYKWIQQALWWHPAHFKLFDIFFLPGQRRTVICMCMSLCSQNSSWNITEKVHCYQIQRFSLDKREKEKWQLQSRVIPRVTVYPNRPLRVAGGGEKKKYEIGPFVEHLTGDVSRLQYKLIDGRMLL